MQSQTIAYVGHRQQHKDSTYGTGEWVKGQAKSVPLAAAIKMLRHPDAYQMADDGSEADAIEISNGISMASASDASSAI